MTYEFKEITLTRHELHVVTNALSVYLMYLREDYDKEDILLLKDKLHATIIDVEKVMKVLLKLDGGYYDM